MSRLTITLLAGSCVLAVAASAFASFRDAQDMKAQGGGWEAMMAAHFAEMDANADGNVSHDEFISFQNRMNERRWEIFSSEAGDDAAVSLDEAKAHHAAMMKDGAGPNCDGIGFGPGMMQGGMMKGGMMQDGMQGGMMQDGMSKDAEPDDE